MDIFTKGKGEVLFSRDRAITEILYSIPKELKKPEKKEVLENFVKKIKEAIYKITG